MVSHSNNVRLPRTVISSVVTVLLAYLMVAISASAAEKRSQQSVDGVRASAAEIDRWVADLDDNQFSTRERAQELLQMAGPPALDAVSEAARDGSLERKTRALNTLLYWSERGEQPDLRISALERVVRLSDRPQESELAKELLLDLKEALALARITEMGGSYLKDRRSRIGIITTQGRDKPPLQVVIDSHWEGGVEGLEALKDVRRMLTLSFHCAPLKPKDMEIVYELPQLQWVELYGIGYNEETFAALIDNSLFLSAERFDIRKSALLGVRGDISHQGALVGDVEAGVAADKAGLRKNDLIEELKGVKIKDFRHLTEQIAQCEGGETAQLKVVRPIGRGPETETVEINVKFDRWGENKPNDSSDTPIHFQVENMLRPRNANLNRR